ncbi:MAG: hypothetical protein EXQ70_08675 [Solirubrobacterales bacterium]|nr:hypothetical protein [Solirubrobacterales bacterium]
MRENRFRWIAVGIGALALIAAVAAIVIANKASDDDAASKEDVTAQVSALRASVVSAGVQLKKGQKVNNADAKKQQANLRKAAKGQASKNAVTDQRIDTIEASISKLQADEKSQSNSIAQLQNSVKQLQQSVDKLSGKVTKLQNR